MKRYLLILILAVTCCGFTLRAADYDEVARKALKFFNDREWASAQALYEVMLGERPDSLDSYAYAIVSSAMKADTLRMTDLLERSASHGVGIYPLFEKVRELSFGAGQAAVYCDFLTLAAREMPWISRPVDATLLDYYLFRDNGPMIIEYASRMHRGLPRSTEYLAALAKGYMLTGEMDNAVTQWKAIVDIDPDNYSALLYLGNYYADNGDRDNARLYLGKAYSVRPTPFVMKRMAECSADSGLQQP